MRKADKIKLSVMVGVSLLAFVVGCVDTAVQPIPTTIVYKSDVSIVNLVAGTGAATVNVYHSIVDQAAMDTNNLATKIDYSSATMSGTANLGATLPASNYREMPSGGIAVVASYANSAAQDTFITSATSQYKMRFFLFGDSTAASRSLVRSTERYTWQTPGSSEGAQVFPSGETAFRFVNGCPDASSLQIQIYSAADDSLIDFGDFNYQDIASYYQLPAGSYYFLIWGDNNVYDSVAVSMGSQKRYSIISYDYNANLKSKVLTDD